ncbi:rod shape-determining protein, partial [Patescibacteria group bacterium]|nr:rod shape-determining protein [Patescibacteria group bacterium]
RWGGAVLGRGVRVAGNDFDQAIITYIRMKYGLLIGANTAERIKIEIGGVGQKSGGKTMIVRGRDLESGLPRSVKVEEGEIMEAMVLKAQVIAKTVSEVLDQSPPELLNDVVAKGILLVGRGANLRGLATMLEHETRIPVQVIEEPGMAVIRGCGILVEDRKKLQLIKRVAGES